MQALATTTTATITPSQDQQDAINAIEAWLDTPSYCRGDLTFGGYAGTGKSTVISYLWPRLMSAGMLFMAPTGKATDVLNSRGMSAVTVHQAIYTFKGTKENYKGDEIPIFEDRDEWSGKEPLLLGCDEASMVPMPVYSDIRKKGISTLWVGDHFQLPPVGEDPGLMRNPHIKLEKIHRQAEGSKILMMAHSIRQGLGWRKQDIDNVSTFVVNLPTITSKVAYAFEHGITQAIVALNATRLNFNKLYRSKARMNGQLDVGDRIVVTHNDWSQMLFNGQLYTIDAIHSEESTHYVVDMKNRKGHVRRNVRIQKLSLGNPDYKKSMRDETMIEADYAYAMTCHKTQGDSFDRVMYVDQPCRAWDVDRHRYTGITRAVSQIHAVV